LALGGLAITQPWYRALSSPSCNELEVWGVELWSEVFGQKNMMEGKVQMNANEGVLSQPFVTLKVVGILYW